MRPDRILSIIDAMELSSPRISRLGGGSKDQCFPIVERHVIRRSEEMAAATSFRFVRLSEWELTWPIC